VSRSLDFLPVKDNKMKEKLRQFRKRVQKETKDKLAEMPFQDKLDGRDPQSCSELADSIYRNMRKEEGEYLLEPDYLKKIQGEIKDTSRAFLIEWVIDVHRKFRLQPETLYVNVHVIDQYLSREPIGKSQLHLLGITTILISTKYEEIYPPKLLDLIQVAENKFSEKAVLEMERSVLQVLDFQVTAPSAFRFMQRFRRLSVFLNDDEISFFA